MENLKTDDTEVTVKNSPKTRKKGPHKKARPISAFFKESILSVAGSTVSKSNNFSNCFISFNQVLKKIFLSLHLFCDTAYIIYKLSR